MSLGSRVVQEQESTPAPLALVCVALSLVLFQTYQPRSWYLFAAVSEPTPLRTFMVLPAPILTSGRTYLWFDLSLPGLSNLLADDDTAGPEHGPRPAVTEVSSHDLHGGFTNPDDRSCADKSARAGRRGMPCPWPASVAATMGG